MFHGSLRAWCESCVITLKFFFVFHLNKHSSASKLRRHKQRFGKIDSTVVLDKDENLL